MSVQQEHHSGMQNNTYVPKGTTVQPAPQFRQAAPKIRTSRREALLILGTVSIVPQDMLAKLLRECFPKATNVRSDITAAYRHCLDWYVSHTTQA